MAKQNIFDNEVFFEGYKKIREKESNANDLFEIPTLFALLPDLKEKKVLDLGCGYGEHCMEYVKKGAKKVVGIDISEKMLEVAGRENAAPEIEYIRMPMEDIGQLEGKFDVVISSLALHYVEDFKGVVSNIYDLLQPGGFFIFSQEHPMNTCHTMGDRWTRDENGKKLHVNISNYAVEKENESSWFIDGIKKYHRMFSTIVNTLVESGFTIERMVEPVPDEELLKKFPEHSDLFHKPDFLVIKVKKA